MATVRQFFSQAEKNIVVDLVKKYKHILESKKCDVVSNKTKSDCWITLTSEFNSHPVTTIRNDRQIKKCWENIKSRSKRGHRDQLARTLGGEEPSPDAENDNKSVAADDALQADDKSIFIKLEVEEPADVYGGSSRAAPVEAALSVHKQSIWGKRKSTSTPTSTSSKISSPLSCMPRAPLAFGQSSPFTYTQLSPLHNVQLQVPQIYTHPIRKSNTQLPSSTYSQPVPIPYQQPSPLTNVQPAPHMNAQPVPLTYAHLPMETSPFTCTHQKIIAFELEEHNLHMELLRTQLSHAKSEHSLKMEILELQKKKILLQSDHSTNLSSDNKCNDNSDQDSSLFD